MRFYWNRGAWLTLQIVSEMLKCYLRRSRASRCSLLKMRFVAFQRLLCRTSMDWSRNGMRKQTARPCQVSLSWDGCMHFFAWLRNLFWQSKLQTWTVCLQDFGDSQLVHRKALLQQTLLIKKARQWKASASLSSPSISIKGSAEINFTQPNYKLAETLLKTYLVVANSGKL